MFIEKCIPHLSSVPTNHGEYQKRIRPSAFGVDLVGTEEGFWHRKFLNFTPDECHTRIHIVDLWVSFRSTRSTSLTVQTPKISLANAISISDSCQHQDKIYYHHNIHHN